MSVKFLKKYHTYNEGEIATFSEQHEKWLVSKHIAESITLPKPDEDDMAKSNANEPQKRDPSQPQNRQTTGTSSKTK